MNESLLVKDLKRLVISRDLSIKRLEEQLEALIHLIRNYIDPPSIPFKQFERDCRLLLEKLEENQ